MEEAELAHLQAHLSVEEGCPVLNFLRFLQFFIEGNDRGRKCLSHSSLTETLGFYIHFIFFYSRGKPSNKHSQS